MPRSHREKTLEIQRSLNRRARLRRAYFKAIGDENKPAHHSFNLEEDREDETSHGIDVNDSDIEHETIDSAERPASKLVAKPLTKKQLAKQKRQEIYHEMKEREKARELAERTRRHKKNTVTKRTSKGQPKLGARVGLLLDKISKSGP